jgi:hypothetical protein
MPLGKNLDRPNAVRCESILMVRPSLPLLFPHISLMSLKPKAYGDVPMTYQPGARGWTMDWTSGEHGL